MGKVLLLDDDASMIRIYEHFLNKAGIETVAASSTAQAIECLTREADSIAFVMLDGALGGDDHGANVAAYIVGKRDGILENTGISEIPPKDFDQDREVQAFMDADLGPKAAFPLFVTLSSNPYRAAGAMASWGKGEFGFPVSSLRVLKKIGQIIKAFDERPKQDPRNNVGNPALRRIKGGEPPVR